MSYACARVYNHTQPRGGTDILVVPWPQPDAELLSPVFDRLEDAQRFFMDAPPAPRT